MNGNTVENSLPLRDQLLAVCLLNADRAGDFQQLLATSGPQTSSPGANLYQAFACARQGKVDEAVSFCQQLPQEDSQQPVAEDLAVNLLHCKAVRQINANDSLGAAVSLGEALKLDPSNAQLQSLLGQIQNAAPMAYLKANRRKEAIEAWETALAREPGNGRLAHSLALACLYWADCIEREHQPEEAMPVWRRAISNWVLTLYNDDFWGMWAAERNTIYPIPDGAVARLRDAWEVEPARRLQRFAQQCSAPAEAERYVRIELDYWLERTTAAALYEIAKVSCNSCRQMILPLRNPSGVVICSRKECGRPLPDYRRPHDIPCAGPIALEQFGMAKQAGQLVQTAAALPNGSALSGALAKLSLPFIKTNADVLRYCLDPSRLGFAYVANGRYAEALSSLGVV